VTVLRAELTLVPVVTARSLVVLGYPSIDRAADARPGDATAPADRAGGLDDELVGCQKRAKAQNPDALGAAAGRRGLAARPVRRGHTSDEADRQAQGCLDALARGEARAERGVVRRRGAGEAVVGGPRVRARRQRAHPGAPGRLPGLGGRARSAPTGWATTCATSGRLYAEFDYRAGVYGHFGHGCVHSRIPFDLSGPVGGPATAAFLERAADLVVLVRGQPVRRARGRPAARRAAAADVRDRS
jgi:hypothetical protein